MHATCPDDLILLHLIVDNTWLFITLFSRASWHFLPVGCKCFPQHSCYRTQSAISVAQFHKWQRETFCYINNVYISDFTRLIFHNVLKYSNFMQILPQTVLRPKTSMADNPTLE